jgi:hypothetical protein
MTTVLARPYRTCGDDRIRPGAWSVSYAGRDLLGPRELDGWDYAADLTVSRRVEVDHDPMMADCDLAPDAVVALVTTWFARGTSTRGVSRPCLVEGTDALNVTTVLPGGELGGMLELTSRLVLLQPGSFGGPLTAHRVGSILWESSPHVIALEGSLARFPISEVDFASHHAFSNGALWALGWDPSDLERPTLGAICLYINSAHPARVDLTGPAPNPTLIDALRVDISRTLIDGALDDPDYDHSEERDGESLGSVLGRLIATTFPGLDTAGVRQLRRSRRSYYESSIQAAIGIGGS